MKTVSVQRVLFLSKAKPLFVSSPLQTESTMTQSTSCCSLKSTSKSSASVLLKSFASFSLTTLFSLGGKVLDGGICGNNAGVESFLLVAVILRLVFTSFRESVERLDLSTCVCRHLVCKSCNKPITCDTKLIFTAAATAHKQRKNDTQFGHADALLACGLYPTTNWKTTKQKETMTKAHQDLVTSKSGIRGPSSTQKSSPSSNSISSSAQYEPHCSRFFTGVTAFITVQSNTFTRGCPRIHDFSDTSSHTTHCCAKTQMHRDPTLTSWQISWLIHLQPVREIVGLYGKNNVHVALEDPRMSVLDCDPTSIHRPDQESRRRLCPTRQWETQLFTLSNLDSVT